VFLNVQDDIVLMKGQVLHLMELHFFLEGVFEVDVFVCFPLQGGHASFGGVCMR